MLVCTAALAADAAAVLQQHAMLKGSAQSFVLFFCRPCRIYYLTTTRQLLVTFRGGPFSYKSLIISIFLMLFQSHWGGKR